MNPRLRLAAFWFLALFACAGRAQAAGAPAGPRATATPERVVLARIGGDDEITAAELVRFASRDIRLLKAARDPARKADLLKEMIRLRLFARAMTDEGLVAAGAGKQPSRAAWRKAQAQLKARHFPYPPPPTEEDAVQYYERHKENFGIPRMVRITQIQFRYPEGATERQKEAARARAEAVWRRLEAGESLEVVGALTENLNAREAKGDLGFLPADTDPWLSKALAGIGKGEHTGVLASPVGYEVMAVTDERAPMIMPFESVREPVMEQMRRDRQKRARNLYARQLAEKYGVEILQKGLEDAIP